MFLWNLLTNTESSLNNDAAPATFWQKWGMMIMLGGIVLLLVLGMFWSSRKRKKQQEETVQRINSLKPGTKVETIGGIFGTIVEMNQEEGTFVLETGSKENKTHIRFDRNAIARIEPEAVSVVETAPAAPVEDEAPEFEPVKENSEEVAETEEKKD